MTGRSPGRAVVRVAAVTLTAALGTVPVAAQEGTNPPLPAVVIPPAPPAPTREQQLESRLRTLEESNRQILDMYKNLAKQNAELMKRLGPGPGAGSAATARTRPSTRQGRASSESGLNEGRRPDGEDGADTADLPGDEGSEASGLSERARRGVGAQGTEGRTFEPETRYRGDEKPRRRKAFVEFAEGLEFSSDDDEFKLTFHDLTQAEFRLFNPGNGILHDQFFIPRQRWYITGRVTKLLEFYTVINRGYGSLDLLDAFLTYRYNESLRFRIGRMKTPYLYEYYQIAEGDLIAPERSLFATNLAENRQEGAMFLGELFRNRVGYAVGVFNGPRRSFQDYNSAKDLFVFFNTRPFLKPDGNYRVGGAIGSGPRTRPVQGIGGSVDSEVDGDPGPLEYLNLGGSFNAGYQNNPAQPALFATANDQSSPASSVVVESLSPTFLVWNANVVEVGQRAAWSAHAVWYYRSAMLLAEYGGGYTGYATVGNKYSNRIPFEGFNVTASYFLTGERITRRVNVVKPRRPFTIRDGKPSGTGAFEVYARYADLNVGKNVFTAGLADPNLYTNQASTIDLGVNWYLNFYTRIYLNWQHAMWGDPVTNGPGKFVRDVDLYWLRFQLFF